jgi:TetR/AcrR family transcriptional regulator, lmrAB and yxaGH operons repressor
MKVDILIGKCYFLRMAKVTDPKEKTLFAAAKLFRRRGFHGTALQDILAAGGAPRGSLYFHFPGGKEEIGEAALTMAGEATRQGIARAAEASESAESFLMRLVRRMASDLEQSGFEEGCPIATTALETSAQSEVLGAATRGAFQTWEHEIARALQRFGIADAEGLATNVLSQLEGALLLARTYHDPTPLQRAERALKVLLSAYSSE